VVVAGRNEALKKDLEGLSYPRRHQVKILGFTGQMDELLRASDLVLSKPGGLTTSEVLACGAAMAIINPIPGQESRNSDFLLEQGAAIKINQMSAMTYKLAGLLASPARLKALKANAKKLGRPAAALEIARRVLAWADHPPGDRL
jgi:processive 1,2-diacylglycerol beta-glucosyltransferase